jgi:adenylate cyclase
LDHEQARLFEGVTRLLAELSARSRCLLVLEDLHWASQSTLQLLHYLAYHLVDQPVSILGTFRSEAVGPRHALRALRRRLVREGHAHSLRLSRLSREAVETMIVDMSGVSEAVLPLARRLYHETEGNPFFLMEIVKALFETGLIRLDGGSWQGDFLQISESEVPLPTGVSEAVQARVLRLGEDVQEAVRRAAVIGHEFDFELLNAVWDQGEEPTLEALDDLLRHRLIDEGADGANSDYVFTHHKIQEVVYEGLPRRRRQHLHGQVGSAMERLLGDEVQARAGELAHHFEQASLLDKSLSGRAVAYLLQAGHQAVRQSANQEAISHYRRALDVLHSLPETPERVQREIEVLIALAGPTTVVYGYGAPESRCVYDLARDLCQRLGEAPELFTALAGLARHYGVSGDVETGLALAEQLLAIAQKSGDHGWLLEACRHMGGVVLDLGRLQEARAFLERGVALYDLAEHEHYAYRFGHDPAVTCLSYLSLTLWLLGYPDRAERQSQALKSLMQSMTHPSSLAYAHAHLALLACIRRDAQAARDHAEAAIRLGQLHGLPMWSAMATALRGWALTQRGEVAEGLAQLEEGAALWQDRGFQHFMAIFLSLQVEPCLETQKLERAAAALSAARAIVESGTDRDLELRTWDLDLLGLDCSTPLASAQVNARLAALRVRLDDGDSIFDTGSDVEVAGVSAGSFSLDGNGAQTLPFTNDDPNVQVSGTYSKTYWVSLEAPVDQERLDVCVNFDPDADASVEGKTPDFRVSVQDSTPTDSGSVSVSGPTVVAVRAMAAHAAAPDRPILLVSAAALTILSLVRHRRKLTQWVRSVDPRRVLRMRRR